MEILALNMEKVYLNSHKKLMKSLLEVKGFSWDEIYPLKLKLKLLIFLKQYETALLFLFLFFFVPFASRINSFM